MQDVNPYDSPSPIASSKFASRFSRRTTFVLIWLTLMTTSLALPVGSLMQGGTPIGTVRVWWWYALLLNKSTRLQALALVVCHLAVCVFLAGFLAFVIRRLFQKQRI